MDLPNSKACLPRFCVTLMKDHFFNSATGRQHMELAGADQSQLRWHEGEGRLTLDPVSKRIADASSRRSISHPFAYHGLPYLLQPAFQAWLGDHPRDTSHCATAHLPNVVLVRACGPALSELVVSTENVQFSSCGTESQGGRY